MLTQVRSSLLSRLLSHAGPLTNIYLIGEYRYLVGSCKLKIEKKINHTPGDIRCEVFLQCDV